MRTSILFIVYFIFYSQVIGQNLLKEVTKTFNNGTPMFIDYLEPEDLKVVKKEIFNETGQLIFSIQYNPKSGFPDGEFFDLNNKGYFKEGILTCYDCILVEANEPSVFTYNYNKLNTIIKKGDVINGRFIGLIEVKAYVEEKYNKIDWESSRKYASAGAGVGFRDVVTVKTGNFKESNLGIYKYNENGVLDGEYEIVKEDRIEKITVKNGISDSYISKDTKGLTKDSLSNDWKIWKIDYKYKKNDGLLVFNNPEKLIFELNPETYWIYPTAPLGENNAFHKFGGLVLIGGKHTVIGTQRRDTGGIKVAFDYNGIFTWNKNWQLEDVLHYNFFPINSEIGFKKENFSLEPNDFKFKFSSLPTRKRENLFVQVYNYLINNDKILLESRFPPYDEQYLVIGMSRRGSENYFNKYINYSSITTYEQVRKIRSSQDFFKNVISIENYLKACEEFIVNKKTEVQSIYVWNYLTEKYDLVDFQKLIEISKQKGFGNLNTVPNNP